MVMIYLIFSTEGCGKIGASVARSALIWCGASTRAQRAGTHARQPVRAARTDCQVWPVRHFAHFALASVMLRRLHYCAWNSNDKICVHLLYQRIF